MTFALAAVLVCLGHASAAEPAASAEVAPLMAPPRPAELAEGPLRAFAPLLGTWEIDERWADGNAIRARNTYTPGIGGRFIEVHTVVSDGEGAPYERYHSMMAWNPETGALDSYGFTYDGTVGIVPLRAVAGTLAPTYEAEWSADGAALRQRIVVDPNGASYDWNVWVRPADAEDWQPIMDGVWHRVEDEATMSERPAVRPIDPALFNASGADVRSFVKTVEIESGVRTVFEAWSTADGWTSVYDAPGMGAEIDLAIGGPYEWYFYDKTGSNGCQVLSYIPDRMISFTWNAPPDQPVTRGRRTWVVVELEPLGAARTRVTLTHLGFGTGPEWDETYAYFDKAWPSVLGAMASKLKPAG